MSSLSWSPGASPSFPATFFTLTFPAPRVLLVTLSRPTALNCIPFGGHEELEVVWEWMDTNPDLDVGVITGSGRAFCGGADLKDWIAAPKDGRGGLPKSGFCGLSMREGIKPVLAAVNGLAVGGGTEVLLNCDMVIASPHATMSLPDVKVGLTLLGGSLSHLVQTVGRGRATEMILSGRSISAQEALAWGLVHRIANDTVKEAVKIACEISAASPDAVQITRKGLLMTTRVVREEGKQFAKSVLEDGFTSRRNTEEGIQAFLERRKPNYVRSKL